MINFAAVKETTTSKTFVNGKKSWTLAQDVVLVELKRGGGTSSKFTGKMIGKIVGHSQSAVQGRYTLLCNGTINPAKKDPNFKMTPENIFERHNTKYEGDEQWDKIYDAFLDDQGII